MWVAQSLTANVAFPLLWAAFIPFSFWEMVAGISGRRWPILCAWGIAWGIGGVAYGLALTSLGASFAYSFVFGITTLAGALLPLFFGVVPWPANALSFGVGLLICMLATAGSSFLGNPGEELQPAMPLPIQVRSFGKGLLLGIAAGLLSAAYGLAFSFEFHAIERLLQTGLSPVLAPIVLALPLNVGAASFAIPFGVVCAARSRSLQLFWSRHSTWNWSLALLMGLFGTGGVFLYGLGSAWKPHLSPNISFGVFMSFLVLGGNLIGMAEHRLTVRSTRERVLLLASVIGLISAAWFLRMS